MKKLLTMWIVSIISLWLIDTLFADVTFSSFGAVAATALVLGILNATLKPILKVVTLPINFMTFGLFSFLINAIVMYAAFAMVEGSSISNPITIVIVSILFGFLYSTITKIMEE